MKEQNHVDNTITTIEMCAGYGGIGLGIKRIFGERLRTIAYCELEGFAQANLISKMEAGLLDAAPLWSDLKTFPYAEFHGLVDILIAGYPCQPFSAAGKRAGKDDPRHLWPWIADGIRLLRPRMCFFENVEGHISLGLSTVISDLEELGYKVSWGIFSASEVGAPHQRKRVFILAYRKSDERGQPEARNWGEMLTGGSAEELANSKRAGLEGQHHRHASAEPSEYVGADAWAGGERGAWPSRPGEQQFAWEPPRVCGGVASGSWVGRQILGQQSRTSEVVCERKGTAYANNDKGHRLSTSEFPTQRTAEESYGSHIGCDDVFRAATEWDGRKSQGRQQVEQLPRQLGVCDGAGEQPAREGHGACEYHGGEQPNGTSDGANGRGNQSQTEIRRNTGEHSQGLSNNCWWHSDDSFWKELEACESLAPMVTTGLAHTGSLGRRGRSDGDAGGLCGEIQVAGSCGGGAEELGNAASDGRQHDQQPAQGLRAATVAESSQCELGNADHGRLASGLNAGSGTEADRGGQGDIKQAEPRQVERTMGLHSHGTSYGLGHTKLSDLCDSELAEIREWMVKCDNRTDELRLLGNGVVPATAERAFRTLMEELQK